MERKYIWFHTGLGFLAGLGSLFAAALLAGTVLVITRASMTGTVIACAFAVLPLPIGFAVDRRARILSRPAR